MAKKKQRKVRTEFRKKYTTRARDADLTRDFEQGNLASDDAKQSERVSGKGSLTRHRTVIVDQDHDETGDQVELAVDKNTVTGRVMSVHGLNNIVRCDDGREIPCGTRGILKSLSTDQRNVITSGDRVTITVTSETTGVIERVEPRHGVLSRTSRGRRHVIVANVDRLLIIGSAAEPMLKPNLIDRFLVTAENAGITPTICINKIDLVDPADLQPLLGVYGQMGYETLLLSATTGQGIDRLKDMIRGKESVLAGQSGVGKSSLLNAVEPGLHLKVKTVSEDNQKGRHTTTAAKLVPLTEGGYVVDTPGIRQFQLWDVIPEEVAGFYRDLRPYVNLCRFPDCTHTHEADCGVKDAVADGRLDVRRYESYCHLFAGDAA